MTIFIGRDDANNTANAALGILDGFTPNDVALLQDLIGDTFVCGSGGDFVFAGDADDKIEGNGGLDTLNGGGGDDAIFANDSANPGGSSIGAVELNGNIGDDRLVGSSGGDTMFGGDGLDRLDGGAGADSMFGGGGDDSFSFRQGDVLPGEILDGEAGLDTIVAHGDVDFTAAAITGFERILMTEASSATLTAQQIKSASSWALDSSSQLTTETLRIEMRGESSLNLSIISFSLLDQDEVRVVGDTDGETITGSASSDWIFGNGGNDILDGGGTDLPISNGGIDTLAGGAGNDLLIAGAGNDVMSGGDGIDTLSFQTSDIAIVFTLPDGGEGLTPHIAGFGEDYFVSIENIAGGTFRDQLTGNATANTLFGLTGNDLLNGAGGIDRLYGGLGDDSYIVDAANEASEAGGGGIDTVRSSVSYVLGPDLENLYLLGSGNINATGNALGNRLIGNSGANLLTGGLGRDVMSGGLGADRFDFNSVAESVARDIITDFAAGTNVSTVDRIDVSTIDANDLVASNQAFIFGGAFAAGHMRATQAGANVILEFNTDGDVAAEMSIHLSNVLIGNLNAGDFFL